MRFVCDLTNFSSIPYVINPSSLFVTKPFDESDALKENWRRVWEDSVASTDDNFSFRHIFLQHFRGQSLELQGPFNISTVPNTQDC